MKTPAKNTDLRHVETNLSAADRAAAINEGKLQKAIRLLGSKWLLHPQYNGHYQPEIHPRAAR